MAVDVSIRFRAESGAAKREINQLQQEIQELRQQLVTTQKRTDTAGAEVKQLGDQSRQTAQSVDKLAEEAKEAAIGVTSLGRNIFKTSAEAKRFGGVFQSTEGRLREATGEVTQTREAIDRLGDEARESAREVDLLGDKLAKTGRGHTDFTRSTEGASRGSQVFTRALGGVGRVLGELGILSATHLLAEFGKSTVRAAGRLELLATGLENVEGSSEAAQRRLAQLDQIARLPGANLDALIQFSNRLRSIGISSEETDNILKNVGQSVVVLGGNAYTATEALEQIAQALQKNTIIMHDFRPIIQRVPGILQSIANVHGVEPSLDGLRLATERLGGSVKDALLPVLEDLGNRFEAPPPESYVRSIDELHNSYFLFQATLGEKFLPAIAASARGLADLFDNIRLFLDTPEAARSADEFAKSLEKINSAASRHQAIEDRVFALRQLELALKSERVGLSNSSEEYLNLSKQIQAAQNEQDRWNTILERSPEAAAQLESEITELNARFQTLNERLKQTEGTRTAASLAQTQRQFDEVSTSLSVANKLLSDVESGFEDTADATTEGTDATRRFISSIDGFGGVLERVDTRFLTFHERVAAFQGTIRTLPSEITGVSDAFEILNPFAAAVATHFANLNLSLRDVGAEAAAFQSTIDAASDPFDEYVAGLQATSVAADAAFGSINRVGRSVRDADFRRAAAELRDFDDAFRLSEATIPRVSSEMERFTGTLPDASRSIRDTTIELRNLSQEAQSAAREAEFLNASFSALDAFDPQTPDVNAPSFDTAGFALRTGEELASQAIRTAGELRRIEEERVENLADLEREYSERIIEINEEKRRKLAEVEEQIEAERLRRLASIEQAFADAAAAEVAAREQAAERILRIEQKAAEDRERLRERLNDRLLELEQRRDARIQELNDGFIERERDRQEAILAVTEQAAAARLDAEQQYADRVQEINNRLVEDVREIQRELQADIESLEAGFVQRQVRRADEIVRITQAAADARAEANQTFTETMEDIYNDLVTAWDNLEEGFLQRQERRAAERIAIEQRAAAARVAANQEYADTVARISRDLVDEVRRLEAEIIDVQASAATDRIAIEQDAIDARAEANADYARELEALEKDRVSATADYAKRIARISTDLVDEVRGIQNEITEIISDATEDRLEIEQDGIDARAAANADYADRIAKIDADTAAKLEENTRRLSEIHGEAVDDKLAADEEYADRFQDIQNDLVDRVVDIQEDLNDTLNDLRDEQLEAEKDRLESLVELHEETQQKLEDLERERTQTVEDLRREYQQDQLDAATQLDRDLEDAEGDPEKEAAARQKFNRRIQDLTREFHRDILELRREQSRERATIARQAAAREIQIAEEAQARQTEIAQQQVDARAAAQAGITAAEEAAGVSFLEAQENYVPALNAHEQALLAHAEALQQINAAEASGVAALEEERGEVLASIDATATAAMTLSETLSAVTAAEQERLTELETQTAETIAGLQSQITEAESQAGLTFETALANYTPAVDLNTQALQALTSALDSISDVEVTAAQTLKDSLSAVTATEQERLAELETQTTGTLAGLNQQITDAETRTGLSFEAALANYTPAVDLNTQALQALTDALTAAEADRLSGLSDIAARGAADRATTTAAQQALETDAGVSIEEARLNYVPALSSATQATLTLNETIQALDASFRAAVAEIQTAGLVDRQAVDAAIQTAIADATAQQTALETQAGTTFADASLAFQPGLSDIAQAGVDRDTAIDDIDQAEIEDIDAINAQAIADRLETDAAITETRDAYIKARDTEIFKHNVAMLQLNTAEAADIKAVRETLNKNLENIDDKLDAELAEIREQKVVFDARMNELITAINEQANQDVASLKEDTAAMRSSLEAIAAEAKDNAWKKALLKIASTGITIAGVAAGAAVGNPVAGLAVGQAVGGVVEEAGNELFHFSQTDRIARNIARQSAYRSSRRLYACGIKIESIFRLTVLLNQIFQLSFFFNGCPPFRFL